MSVLYNEVFVINLMSIIIEINKIPKRNPLIIPFLSCFNNIFLDKISIINDPIDIEKILFIILFKDITPL